MHHSVVIERLDVSDSGVSLVVGGRPLDLSWQWLRDHARDPESYHASAEQRLVAPSVVAAAGEGHAHLVDGGAVLVVDWPGVPATQFRAADLSELGTPSEMYTPVGPAPDPWIGSELGPRLVRLGFSEIDDEQWLDDALTGIWRDGVIVVEDVPLDLGASRLVVERFGYPRASIFGDVWEFGSDGALDDTASTPLEIMPHTDATYSHDAPGLIVLHCLRYDAVGGDNTFVDALSVLAHLDDTAPEVLDTLRRVDIPGRYIGDGAHLVARRPVLRFEGERFAQVSYNHHDRAPMLLPEPEMTAVYRALSAFDRAANDPDLQFELALRPREAVVFDNWRLLHGRRAFDGDRWLGGGYVNREDLESTTRSRRGGRPS